MQLYYLSYFEKIQIYNSKLQEWELETRNNMKKAPMKGKYF